MPSLYFLAAGVLMAALVGITEEFRLHALRGDVHRAQQAQHQAEEDLKDYQVAAAGELARRLVDNTATETRAKQEIANARQDYEERTAAIDKRWGKRVADSDARLVRREQAAAATGRRLPVSAAPVPGERTVDDSADSDGLQRCLPEARRAAIEDLMHEADVNTAKLLECQRRILVDP